MKKFKSNSFILTITIILVLLCGISVAAEEDTNTEHVHRFANHPTYTRQSEDTWTAYFYCVDNCGFSATVDCDVNVTHGEPTCTEYAYNVYNISVDFYGKTYTKKVSDYLRPLGHDYTNGPCSRCGIKPLAKLEMPETVKFTYSGEPYSVVLTNADELSGNIVYKYYINSALTSETTPDNSGAAENGGAPANVGKYFVQAIHLEDDNYRETTSSVCSLYIKPNSVPELTVANTNEGVMLTWSYCPDAAYYTIYRHSEGGSYCKVGTVEGAEYTSCIDTSVDPDKYYYNITFHQKGANGIGVESDLRIEEEAIYYNYLTISNTSSGAKLKWKKNPDASGYYIYRKTKGQSKYYKVKTISKNSTLTWTDTSKKSISNGRRSYYYVKPYFKKAPDAVRETAIVKNYFLSRPKPWASGRNLDWSANKSATGYQVEKQPSLGEPSYTNKTSSIYKYFWPKKASLTKGRVRAYKVVDGVKYYSAWSKTVVDKRLPKQLR